MPKIEIDAKPAIARALRELRKSRGYTQAQVAGEVGHAQATVARWENGTRTPDANELARLAAVYEVNPGLFFSEVGPQIQEARRALRRSRREGS
jgi:transcriptional regulator with XRE-family HTH domain